MSSVLKDINLDEDHISKAFSNIKDNISFLSDIYDVAFVETYSDMYNNRSNYPIGKYIKCIEGWAIYRYEGGDEFLVISRSLYPPGLMQINFINNSDKGVYIHMTFPSELSDRNIYMSVNGKFTKFENINSNATSFGTSNIGSYTYPLGDPGEPLVCYFWFDGLDSSPISIYSKNYDISYVDVNSNPSLKNLTLPDNSIRVLDLSKCINLETINLSSNGTTKMTLPEFTDPGVSKLQILWLNYCNLLELNITNHDNLQKLSLYSNRQLKDIYISHPQRIYHFDVVLTQMRQPQFFDKLNSVASFHLGFRDLVDDQAYDIRMLPPEAPISSLKMYSSGNPDAWMSNLINYKSTLSSLTIGHGNTSNIRDSMMVTHTDLTNFPALAEITPALTSVGIFEPEFDRLSYMSVSQAAGLDGFDLKGVPNLRTLNLMWSTYYDILNVTESLEHFYILGTSGIRVDLSHHPNIKSVSVTHSHDIEIKLPDTLPNCKSFTLEGLKPDINDTVSIPTLLSSVSSINCSQGSTMKKFVLNNSGIQVLKLGGNTNIPSLSRWRYSNTQLTEIDFTGCEMPRRLDILSNSTMTVSNLITSLRTATPPTGSLPGNIYVYDSTALHSGGTLIATEAENTELQTLLQNLNTSLDFNTSSYDIPKTLPTT